MDNLTHSLVGAALAEAGPRDRVVLATPTLVLAANVPDVDIASYLIGGEFAALAWRRGITHGVPALLLWPFVVAALVLAWDRHVRRRRDPTAAPARFGPLLGLAALGAATHPGLDWLNTYGMRWWLPFDGTWSYGDAVFIVDPWLWLVPGGAVFLARSARRRAVAAWAVLAALASLPVLALGMVPAGTKVVWIAGILALGGVRWLRPLAGDARRRSARVAVAGAAGYVLLMIGTAALAERGARTGALARGLDVVDVMSGPRPGSLAARDVIVRTPGAYHPGSWRWGRTPALELAADEVPIRRGPDAAIDRALHDPRVRHFLTWSRFPYAHVTEVEGGWSVRFGDARYSGRGLGGLDIRVDD
ncbi:MAG TPA: metal-dependent hydrolase [Longimicrobiales bacterium]|nr:metal-dependent hydrolase [Longimicrobiales bacterium]